MATIKGLLFDADGVIQKAPDNLGQLMADVLEDPTQDVDSFMKDIFAAEYPTCTNKGDFRKTIERVLMKWDCKKNYDKLLKVWLTTYPDLSILELVRELHSRGIFCGLASNQPRCRARFMSKNLGYNDIFHSEFYYCDIGYNDKKGGRNE